MAVDFREGTLKHSKLGNGFRLHAEAEHSSHKLDTLLQTSTQRSKAA